MQLEVAETAGMTSYVPRLVVDYTKGVYPILLGLGYAGGIAYIAAYAGLLAKKNICC